MASEADERALHVALPEAELLPRQVNKLLRDIAERAASRLEATSPARAARVRQASAH
jgi:hypothetical protein